MFELISIRRLFLALLALLITATATRNTARADSADDFNAAIASAVAAAERGDHATAARNYSSAMALTPELFGANSKNMATIMSNLANEYLALGQYPQAENLQLRSLEIRKTVFGAKSLDVAASLNNLGLVLKEQAKFKQAEAAYLNSVEIRKTALKNNDVLFSESYTNLALLYMAQARYERAETYFLDSKKIDEAAYGRDHPEVATDLAALAELYRLTGRFSLAQENLQRSINIRKEKLAPNHPLTRETQNSLAIVYQNIGKFDQAESLYLGNLDLDRRQFGNQNLTVATDLLNLAILDKLLGQYEKSEKCNLECLTIREAKLGLSHPAVADVLNNLADLYCQTKRYDKAEPLYQRGLKIVEDKFGASHPDVARILHNQATLYFYMEQYDRVESLLQRSLKIYADTLRPDHQSVLLTQNELGDLYRVMGKYDQAEMLCRHVLELRKSTLGSNHIDVEESLSSLANIHAELNQIAAATDEFDQARRLQRRHAADVLPMLSESQQMKFLENIDRESLHAALSFAWQHQSESKLAERSAGWLANGKVLAQETLAQRAALGRDTQDVNLKALVAELNDTRTQWAQLTNAADSAEKSTRIVQLIQREHELAKQLSHAGGAKTLVAWVEFESIRQQIPRDAMLVDIVRLEAHDFKAKAKAQKTLSPRYVAWLTPAENQGDVRLIDLGDAADIDAVVQKLRQQLRLYQSNDKTSNPLLALGEGDAEKQLQTSLAAVGKLVLDPLAESLKDKTEIILSPDAALWLVPWCALPLPGEPQRYAVEKWKFRFVTSARELAAKFPQTSNNGPRIFSNPNYDLAASDLPKALASVFGNVIMNGATRATDAPLLASADVRSAGLGRVARLPGTAAEAAAVTPSLKTLTGNEPKNYAENAALEGVFKHLKAPRILLVSTHGYFMPDQTSRDQQTLAFDASSPHDDQHPLIDTTGAALENPLVRCGLLFAGCNNRDNIPVEAHLDDGILTGLEIVGTDLRGTELVVLSACETSLGQVNNGEGVAGLRQAFQLAGAQSVVATLWQIPDQATAQLMNDFFANLAAGQAKSEALRNAQLARIKSRREKFGAAHPLFWAAFTLTGQST